MEPEKIHVHHSYVWLGSIRTVLLILFVAVVSSFSSLASLFTALDALDAGEVTELFIVFGFIAAGLIVLIAIIVIVQILSYKHLYYTLGSEEFSLYSGIFIKKRVHVPYSRVQSVDQHATLLQRIFGVCNVTIDTAGGSANKAIQVPYVTKQNAEMLRVDLFGRKQAIMNGTSGVVAGVGVAGAPAAGVVAGAGASAAATMGVPAAAVGAPAASAGVMGAAAGAPAAVGSAGIPAAAAAVQTVSQGNILDVGDKLWGDIGGVFAGQAQDTGAVSYEYGLTNKELILTGFTNNTAFIFIILGLLGVLSQIFTNIMDINPDAADYVMEGAISIITRTVDVAVMAFIGGLVVLWLISVIGSCLNYGGFHARRRGTRVEVEHGLLQHTFQGVDIDRVQAVVVKQSFIRRIIGYCELSLEKIDAAQESNADSQSTQQRGVVIHPFLKVSRVPEILAGLVPEYGDVPSKRKSVAPVALRRALIRRCLWQGNGFWVAVSVAIIQILVNAACTNGAIPELSEALIGLGGITGIEVVNLLCTFGYILAVILLVFDIVGAILWARESGFGYNRYFMQVKNGGLSSQTKSFPRQKIQFGYTKTNPFQRMAKTATINARTAAGVGGTTVTLIDVKAEDADMWLDWVLPRTR